MGTREAESEPWANATMDDELVLAMIWNDADAPNGMNPSALYRNGPPAAAPSLVHGHPPGAMVKPFWFGKYKMPSWSAVMATMSR
jgi:hypothetical protein